jgi:hypothetical protein
MLCSAVHNGERGQVKAPGHNLKLCKVLDMRLDSTSVNTSIIIIIHAHNIVDNIFWP